MKFQNLKSISFDEIRPFYLDALKILGTYDINDNPSDISCKCPICGDSKYKNKKRLHLYQKGEVINVNCFNGDCPVKNLTPYTFFKTYCNKVFIRYREYYKKRYLNQVLKPKDEFKVNLDWMGEAQNTQETQNQISKLDKFIENFEYSTYEEDFKKILNFLKENPSYVNEFKERILK